MARPFPNLKAVLPALCVGAVLFAQLGLAQSYKVGETQAPLQRPRLSLVGSGCPALIKADQRASTQRIETSGIVPGSPAQGLTVTIVGSRSLRIASAEIVAHALSAKNRAILTTDRVKPDVTRSFHLVARADGRFGSELWMDGVTSICSIEVKSLTYSDGSVWQESETTPCTVVPNPLVLVASAR